MDAKVLQPQEFADCIGFAVELQSRIEPRDTPSDSPWHCLAWRHAPTTANSQGPRFEIAIAGDRTKGSRVTLPSGKPDRPEHILKLVCNSPFVGLDPNGMSYSIRRMTKPEFLNNIEELVEVPAGTLSGPEKLEDLEGWNSMAMVGFIALADSNGAKVTARQIAGCDTVAELMSLAKVE